MSRSPRTPLVSVLLPVYNQENTILPALKSVLAQQYQNLETLILDDASSDRSEFAVRTFLRSLPLDRAQTIRYLKNKTNLRLQKNLNRGLTEARGELIARIDGDDLWIDPEKLTLQVSFLIQHPNYALVGGGARERKKYGSPVDYLQPETDAAIRKHMLIQNPFWHGSVVFRKDALPSLAYNEAYTRTEDHELWMRIGMRWKLYNFPRIFISRDDFHDPEHFFFHGKRTTELRGAREHLRLIHTYRTAYPNALLAVLKVFSRVIAVLAPAAIRRWFAAFLRRSPKKPF